MVTFYAFLSEHKKGKVAIRLCDDIIDRHAGTQSVSKVFTQELGVELDQTSADGRFSLENTPCIGMSDQAPAALINDVVVTNLTPERARDIANALKAGQRPEELELPQGDGNNAHPLVQSTVNNNIRLGGDCLLSNVPDGAALKNALSMSRQSVIKEIDQSGLTGRGGAGFPTARKWQMAAKTKADKRFVFCNADEGEPGTFKDRVLLTERAELMIEGMTLAAYAIGSEEGMIYLRAEYAYLRAYLESVLQDRRDNGWLGSNIGGKDGFNFDIRIQMGAGAYICGEESALISSCEGLRGEPKNRPPFPVESGYLGYPTVVDNVETFCCAARILGRGSDWFSALGTEQSTGTKLFSVSGDCETPGVYELPFGTTVGELLEMAGGADASAVQVGGPSGEMINRSQFQRRLCNEDLPTGGSIMVFSAHRNLLEIVEYFMDFFIEESCGYCTPCRVGNVFLKMRLQKIRKGLCQRSDIDYLKDLGKTVAMTSRCGLGYYFSQPNTLNPEKLPLGLRGVAKRKRGWHAGFF